MFPVVLRMFFWPRLKDFRNRGAIVFVDCLKNDFPKSFTTMKKIRKELPTPIQAVCQKMSRTGVTEDRFKIQTTNFSPPKASLWSLTHILSFMCHAFRHSWKNSSGILCSFVVTAILMSPMRVVMGAGRSSGPRGRGELIVCVWNIFCDTSPGTFRTLLVVTIKVNVGSASFFSSAITVFCAL